MTFISLSKNSKKQYKQTIRYRAAQMLAINHIEREESLIFSDPSLKDVKIESQYSQCVSPMAGFFRAYEGQKMDFSEKVCSFPVR